MKTSFVTAQQNGLLSAVSKIRSFMIGCLSVLTLLASEATATELLTNCSFDVADGAGWGAVTNTQFATPGAAYLHPIPGFMGTVLWQNLDVADVGSATGTASIAMTTVPTPPGGNTISVYLEYTIAGGTTNRLLLLNPYNVTIVSNMPNSSVFSTAFALPAEAQRIVRFSVEKAGYGSFYAQEFSLDIVLAGGGVPDLGLSIANMSEGAIVAAPFVLRAGVANLTANVSSLAFYANDILIGQGVLAPYGEWEFSDGSHLSVMSNDGREMLDYTPPHPSVPYMYMIGGVRTSLDNFNGTFTCYIDTNQITGPVSASSSLTAGQLSASLSGDSPLGNHTLVNGTCLSDTVSYGLFWNPPANGNYAITARAIYNSGLVTTAAVVNISVTDVVATPIPTLTITSPTAGQRIAAPSSAFTVTGTAADDVAVSAVYRKVNNSAWQLATGTSLWSSAVTLVAGTNTIRAYCVDASGNSSATSSVVCTLVIDTVKPMVAITSPTLTPVQRITAASPDFTVRGTAGDIGAGVVAVRCQLNNGEWLQATGTNVWNCPVTLVAGPNTVKAYSMDAAGNSSLTQKVSCIYAVTTPIEISKTGNGAVGVYTNRQLLEIGKAYTLTAMPAAGFVLKNWTTNGSVAGTTLSFSFIMRQNLTVCANFIDTVKPTVTFVAPTPTQRITAASPDFTVRGTAGDIGAGVVAVRCQLNNGEWLQATGTNVWSCPVALNVGMNTVMAYSMDAAGNCSLTQKVSCICAVTTPIGISKTGNGTVGVYTNGQLLESGKSYTLTATPAMGFALQNWTYQGADITFFYNGNIGAVLNGPPVSPTVFTLAAEKTLTSLQTYHWNVGKGKLPLGTLSLSNSNGTVYGPWPVVGLPGQGGVPNAYWKATPNILLEAGTYTIIDSDPSTWSQNSGSLGKGFAWANAAEGIATTPSFSFTMRSGLLVCANFIDIVKPAVVIASPTAAQRIVAASPAFTVRGTASDIGAGVAAVRCQINNGDWQIATGTNVWTNIVTLEAGPNTIKAYSRDAAGNCSPTASVVCTYVVTTPIGIAKSGMGTVGIYTNGQLLEIGKSYTLTATPAAGFVLRNWTTNNIASGTASPFIFTMRSNLTVCANFIEKSNLNAQMVAGLNSLSEFADTNRVPRGQAELVASAAANFDLVARNNPNNYTNRIYNAMTILLNLVNDPTFHSRAELYGVNMDDLFDPVCNFPTNAPKVDVSVDALALVALPAIDKAWGELNAVPATWPGIIEISPDKFPIDEAVWIDIGDVTAMKAALKGLRAFIGMLKAYSCNLDYNYIPDIGLPEEWQFQVLRANHPELFSRIRNVTSLAGVKTDLLAALNGYLAADTLIARRSGLNAQLLHFVGFDAADPAAVEDRQNKKFTVETIRTSLNAPVQVEGDSDIEGTVTRPVYLGAFFNAPYITTNVFPSGLHGTITNLGYDVFPDPTFHGILPGMTRAKLDKYLLGYTHAGLTTVTSFPNAQTGYLRFWVDTDRALMVITNVTVSGPGIPLPGMDLTWDVMYNEWNVMVPFAIASKPAVGSVYTVTVYFSDGTHEHIDRKLTAWMTFSSSPTLSGSVLRWPAVVGADHYKVRFLNGYSEELPATQKSFDLGYVPDSNPFSWVEAWDANGNVVNGSIVMSPARF